jgi:hypothetical protein
VLRCSIGLLAYLHRLGMTMRSNYWQGDANELMVRTRKLYKTCIKNKHGDGTNYRGVSYCLAQLESSSNSLGAGSFRAEQQGILQNNEGDRGNCLRIQRKRVPS